MCVLWCVVRVGRRTLHPRCDLSPVLPVAAAPGVPVFSWHECVVYCVVLAVCVVVSVLPLVSWKFDSLLLAVVAGLGTGQRPTNPLLWQTRDLTQAGVGANPRRTGGVGVGEEVRVGNTQVFFRASIDYV